jgi:hypothetical protein
LVVVAPTLYEQMICQSTPSLEGSLETTAETETVAEGFTVAGGVWFITIDTRGVVTVGVVLPPHPDRPQIAIAAKHKNANGAPRRRTARPDSADRLCPPLQFSTRLDLLDLCLRSPTHD